METIKDDGELLEKMSWVAKKTGNKTLSDMCAMGMFTAPNRQEVRAVMAAASEEWLEGQIKAAIAHGDMAPPTVEEAMEFQGIKPIA